MASAVKQLFTRMRGSARTVEDDLAMPAGRLAAMRSRASLEIAEFAPFGLVPPGGAGTTLDLAPGAPGLQPIILARKPRQRGEDWSSAASWFGGRPRLGEAEWPRSKDGLPLPFAAQISLSEIAAVRPSAPLPASGSLAFFLGDGAVIHVPEDVAEDTAAPGDLPPASDEGGYPFQPPSLLSRQLFPFWPVEPIAIDLPWELRDYRDGDQHDAIHTATNEAIAARVPRREHRFAGKQVAGQLGIGNLPLWWHGGDLFVSQLKQALSASANLVRLGDDARAAAQARLTTLEALPDADSEALDQARRELGLARERQDAIGRQITALPEFIAAVEAFTARREPWTPLDDDEAAILEEAMAVACQQFPDIVRSRASHTIDFLTTTSLRAMMTGDAAAFAAMPEAMLDIVNRDYRLPASGLQQMFGLGSTIQNAVYEHEQDILLLQLHYDDMMDWRFGDMGAFQFWIAPTDLAGQRWDRVTLTFECG